MERSKLHTRVSFLVRTPVIGYIKNVGKIYQQTAIDTDSNVGFAKVYPDKTALTAADFLNNKVLLFFDFENIALLRILTDRGTEYCGRIETHPYQLFLHLNGVEHSRTKVRHPQTNRSTERLNQIVQNELYKVAFRKNIYKTIEEIQIDLDTLMDFNNTERTNQGNIAKLELPSRPSRMEGFFIKNMFLKTQRKEKSRLKSCRIS